MRRFAFNAHDNFKVLSPRVFHWGPTMGPEGEKILTKIGSGWDRVGMRKSPRSQLSVEIRIALPNLYIFE